MSTAFNKYMKFKKNTIHINDKIKITKHNRISISLL